MRKLIAGNWKMNGLGADIAREVEALAASIADAEHVDLLLCPTAVGIVPMRHAAEKAGIGDKLAVGGQDCHAAENGAHTGDISAAMLADVGCRYAIVGHSERRTDHGETSEGVAAKAKAALGAGLVAIVCIGETEAERKSGETFNVLADQIAKSLPAGATAENTVIAYEPVWAIGTGLTPTSDDIAAAHKFIREEVARKIADADKVRILYGGSMKPGNAGEILALDGVDGGLIGGASLEADDFLAIARAAGS